MRLLLTFAITFIYTLGCSQVQETPQDTLSSSDARQQDDVKVNIAISNTPYADPLVAVFGEEGAVQSASVDEAIGDVIGGEAKQKATYNIMSYITVYAGTVPVQASTAGTVADRADTVSQESTPTIITDVPSSMIPMKSIKP